MSYIDVLKQTIGYNETYLSPSFVNGMEFMKLFDKFVEIESEQELVMMSYDFGIDIGIICMNAVNIYGFDHKWTKSLMEYYLLFKHELEFTYVDILMEYMYRML